MRLIAPRGRSPAQAKPMPAQPITTRNPMRVPNAHAQPRQKRARDCTYLEGQTLRRAGTDGRRHWIHPAPQHAVPPVGTYPRTPRAIPRSGIARRRIMSQTLGIVKQAGRSNCVVFCLTKIPGAWAALSAGRGGCAMKFAHVVRQPSGSELRQEARELSGLISHTDGRKSRLLRSRPLRLGVG
jgi:hypothetical protein